jgi:hypothetical protein
MALGNAYEMLSDFYKAHPEVLKKEIKGVKLMFIHAYPVGDCVMTKSAPILKLDDIKGKKLGFEGGGLRFETMRGRAGGSQWRPSRIPRPRTRSCSANSIPEYRAPPP